MRANHVPTIDRLQKRVDRLCIQLGEYLRRIGRGNPYQQCKHCGISQPELSFNPHRKGCPVPGWAKEIIHYQGILMDEMGITDPKMRLHVINGYSSLFHSAGVADLLANSQKQVTS